MALQPARANQSRMKFLLCHGASAIPDKLASTQLTRPVGCASRMACLAAMEVEATNTARWEGSCFTRETNRSRGLPEVALVGRGKRVKVGGRWKREWGMKGAERGME